MSASAAPKRAVWGRTSGSFQAAPSGLAASANLGHAKQGREGRVPELRKKTATSIIIVIVFVLNVIIIVSTSGV
jgi:hypothetical protein